MILLEQFNLTKLQALELFKEYLSINNYDLTWPRIHKGMARRAVVNKLTESNEPINVTSELNFHPLDKNVVLNLIKDLIKDQYLIEELKHDGRHFKLGLSNIQSLIKYETQEQNDANYGIFYFNENLKKNDLNDLLTHIQKLNFCDNIKQIIWNDAKQNTNPKPSLINQNLSLVDFISLAIENVSIVNIEQRLNNLKKNINYSPQPAAFIRNKDWNDQIRIIRTEIVNISKNTNFNQIKNALNNSLLICQQIEIDIKNKIN